MDDCFLNFTHTIIFWADPITVSVVDYNVFGEVVTFDTTFKTNKCNLSLRIFC